MGVRKNAKFLSAVERENFVKACVLMKADIVNPAAPVADRYSKWDEAVAIHRMIQNANAPGGFNNINFGHGGPGSYSFLSWHRFFLSWFEQNLRSYLPGVDFWLPYWDWSDPAPLMTDTFLGPDGSGGLNIVSSGYFAPNAPATGGNPTPSPAWWPASLTGWNLANGFGALTGPLTRNLSALAGLPSTADLQTSLARTTYSSFQNTLESGAGLVSGHQMHNGLHGWFGGHMATLTGSPFDPFFYLHHCNIDRLWAMWQMDGHANLYPAAGADPQHGPNNIMYPWTGGTPGYSSNLSFGVITMPDFSGLGIKRNVDMLDHRALGYTYDTMAVIGIGLDRTGSMTGLTPDPMTGVGNVTKWEAAKRGVSAFMQDCETVQASAAIYVTAGVKTFRSLPANTFTPVFAGTPYGLIKNGTAYSKASFDNAVALMSPGGGTPLADALLDVEATLVAPPFGWLPADEQRYLAMLTDGMLTSGAPLASIPNNSLNQTAVFAMGFGTPADVDYPTLSNIVAKGKTLAGVQQVFHGENAGTIDKFYSNALAKAIGFVAVFDPVLELFAGEHAHMEFSATSADDSFLITAQGMDYEDANWSYQLLGPNQTHVYGDGMLHPHGSAGHGRMPSVTARRSDGRLTLVLQRDSADHALWVGTWTLMVAYRARDMSAMVMTDLGELMWPVAAGPVRGPRYTRVLQSPKERRVARTVVSAPRHEFDVRPASTNNATREACSVVINVYAQTRLRLELNLKGHLVAVKQAFEVVLGGDVLSGSVSSLKGFARLAAPTHDIAALVARVKRSEIPEEARLEGSQSLRFDTAHVLALLERKNPEIAILRDEIAKVAVHGGPLHVHVKDTSVPGVHHLGIYVEGLYCPELDSSAGADHEHASKHEAKPSASAPTCTYERFTRLFNVSIAIGDEKPQRK